MEREGEGWERRRIVDGKERGDKREKLTFDWVLEGAKGPRGVSFA